MLITTVDSWEDFSRWGRKKIERKTEPDEAIKGKVAELVKGLSTPQEKIEAVFDYVKREVRYVSIDLGKSGYEPEANVPCSWLFTSSHCSSAERESIG
ncbi:MAG: hypothetical protein ACUVWO_02595 [Thermodesulfobacteriota bacterium]